MQNLDISQLLSSLVSIIAIVSCFVKNNTAITSLKCSIDNLAKVSDKREVILLNLEQRIRELEIKSANCGCNKKN